MNQKRPRKKGAEEAICRWVSKTIQAAYSTKPIPPTVLRHAKNCSDCLAQLSRSLSINKSYFLTQRFSDEHCPHRIIFRQMILFETREKAAESNPAAKTRRRSGEKARKLFNSIKRHLRSCASCRRYYENLKDAAEKYRKEYEAMIKSGAEIKPLPVDMRNEPMISEGNDVEWFKALEAGVPEDGKLLILEAWLPKDREKQKPN